MLSDVHVKYKGKVVELPTLPPARVYWCGTCHAPVLRSVGSSRWEKECPVCGGLLNRVARDVRPVFPEEKLLLEVLLDLSPGELLNSSVWDTSGNNLIVDGKTMVFPKGQLMKDYHPDQVRELFKQREVPLAAYEIFHTGIKKFVEINQMRYNEILYNAERIIEAARELEPEALPVVSFSGGKDSTVVSDLVRRNYASQSILHVFGDTTLELEETSLYVTRFKQQNPTTPFLIPKSDHDFHQLCKAIGPPSRVMRWCCTVFKTGPISRIFDGISGDRTVLTFYGVRWSESSRRQGYHAIEVSPKVSTQTVVSPIIAWTDADIWLYILHPDNNLDFNRAYRLGFSRVGCWCCPSNSKWSFFLTRIYYPELAEPWRKFLIDFAQSLGKKDPENYVDSGNWKARQGGHGLEDRATNTMIHSSMCGNERSKRYRLSKPITRELYEYFKPFGKIDHSRGRSVLNEVYIVDPKSDAPLLVLQGLPGSYELMVTVVNRKENATLLLHRVDCQIRKYQSCIRCGGCPSICPTGAIRYSSKVYSIDDSKCVHCLKCISHFDTGCLVSKVLKVRKEDVS